MTDQRDEILISIKPEDANKIFAGTKKWEYRRRIWKGPVEKVFVYSTLPIGKVVGFFFVGKILRESPEQLWETTKTHGGIFKDSFFKYFHGVEYGHAIHIQCAKLFRDPMTLHEWNYDIKSAPKSFMYV